MVAYIKLWNYIIKIILISYERTRMFWSLKMHFSCMWNLKKGSLEFLKLLISLKKPCHNAHINGGHILKETNLFSVRQWWFFSFTGTLESNACLKKNKMLKTGFFNSEFFLRKLHILTVKLFAKLEMRLPNFVESNAFQLGMLKIASIVDKIVSINTFAMLYDYRTIPFLDQYCAYF